MRKNYVLDANILLHDPASIFHFADNNVIIPVAVVEEIDRFKKEMTERGYNARAVARLLDSVRGERNFASGIPLKSGGMLRVHCDPEQAIAPMTRNGDVEVLKTARAVQQDDPNTPAIIVTKDINLRIRADAAGLRAEDYESDHVRLADLETGNAEIALDAGALEQFDREGAVNLPDVSQTAAPPSAGPRTPGEYVVLRGADPRGGAKRSGIDERSAANGRGGADARGGTDSRGAGDVPGAADGRTATNGRKPASRLARIDAEGKRAVALRVPDRAIGGIRPRNKEQYFALDALLDDSVQLVTLMGKAGTGKTLLAMSAAIHKTLVERAYRGILVARPIVPLGRDLGYLPGEIERKLEPWMKPITDTVDFILSHGDAVAGYHDSAAMLRSGAIEIQPLAYIRGRNIANQFVVIDESQNLTPLEVKTVITRIGQRAKVVLTGDPYQIDNPYVDASSNGFSYLVNRFHGQAVAAHVSLHKGERSTLAELAANLL